MSTFLCRASTDRCLTRSQIDNRAKPDAVSSTDLITLIDVLITSLIKESNDNLFIYLVLITWVQMNVTALTRVGPRASDSSYAQSFQSWEELLNESLIN